MNLFHKLVTLVRFLGVYTFNFWKANLLIAKQVLSPKCDLEAETIELDSRVETPLQVLSLANAITFTPGTLVTDMEPGESIRVHILGDPDEARESIPATLEQPIFELTQDDH